MEGLQKLPHLTPTQCTTKILQQHVSFLTEKVSNLYEELTKTNSKLSCFSEQSETVARNINQNVATLSLDLQNGLLNVQGAVDHELRALSEKTHSSTANAIDNDHQDTRIQNDQMSSPYVKALQTEQYENAIQEAADQIKKSMIHIWKDKLNKRKTAYWNFLRHEKQADTYFKWMQSKPVILPKKLIPKLPDGEAEGEHDSRVKETMFKFQELHNRLIIKSRNYHMKMESIDHEMITDLSQRCGHDFPVQEKVTQMWQETCRKEEEKSAIRWSEKASWLTKYEMDFLYSKPGNKPQEDNTKPPIQIPKHNDNKSLGGNVNQNQSPGGNVNHKQSSANQSGQKQAKGLINA